MTKIKHLSQPVTFKVKVAAVEVLRKVSAMVMETEVARYLDSKYLQKRSVEVPEQKDFSQKMVADELTHLPKLLTAEKKRLQFKA